MKIALLAFAGSESTLGLTIVKEALALKFTHATFFNADTANVKDADFLMVSLYWWRDIYNFVNFLHEAGVDPRERQPIIIVGGMQALNPRPIRPYFHYAVIGDGEAVIGELVERLARGEEPDGLDGVWRDGPTKPAYATRLIPQPHVDQRTNKTTRVELARGCKQKCPFCELAFFKPYREAPFEIIKQLIVTSPTKNIALFAPDAWSHSRAEEIHDACIKAHKNNTGQDVRLDTISKVKHASTIRFGVEAFGEKTRRHIGKMTSNARLVEKLSWAFNEIKSAKGRPLSMGTMYVIGDLPGEGSNEIHEFCDCLAGINDRLSHKVTLFLSVSSFAPSPLTPMWRCGIDPWTSINATYSGIMDKTKGARPNLILAHRGAVIGPAPRLAQTITIRGDERLSRVVFWLATQRRTYLNTREPAAARQIIQACRQVGFPPEDLWRELEADYQPPWGNIINQDESWRMPDWRRGGKQLEPTLYNTVAATETAACV